MKKLKLFRIIICVFVVSLIFTSCAKSKNDNDTHENRKNNYVSYPQVKDLEEGMSWPDGQALPTLAAPAETLDAVKISNFTTMEQTMLACLQGIVNSKKPRIMLLGSPEEGFKTWPEALNLKINEYSRDDRYEIIKKYAGEVSGVVLYDNRKSVHYINLANTVGNIKKALPVTESMYNKLKNNGIDLPVVEDLTTLEYKTPIDIYNYMYDTYWKDCTKKLIASMNPTGHTWQVRDMAAAAGAAVVWLDCKLEEEKALYGKFLSDMTPGNAIAIGWYTEERSGIGTGVQHGISTIPSDFFENSTVYAGMPHYINKPVVPDKPELENKVYIAIFLSDGDNVQYVQHKMNVLWRNKERGTVPINWTVSPGLVDFAPGILNYYYSTATPGDFLASGPSGLGYALLYDTRNKIDNMTNKEHADAYTKFTQTYLERSGIRVITAWDLVKDIPMEAFATNCRYLYGSTIQDWDIWGDTTVEVTKFVQNKLAFVPNYPCYADKIETIYEKWQQKIKDWDGNSPLFLSSQGNSWKMTPQNIKLLKAQLEELQPGKIEILRGDHFFALLNEANGLPFNLALSSKVKVEASDNGDKAALVVDGTPSGDSLWTSSANEKWLKFDLGGEYEITRYVVRHAGDNGLDPAYNTKDFRLEVSTDGTNWTQADKYVGNTANVTDIDIDPVKAKYARLIIDNPGSDGTARIAEVELYARVVK